ncbi:MAG: anhydro-N-acetylmuramic acid kinase [Candidatus Eremiobacteraeota bacterium]|nr:anhydro-N-acetylmuramic acid kinase [Candidatus Eremiobacteraeota bacterium]
MIAVGLISGTSLDGIDAALVRIVPTARSYEFEIQAFATVPYEPRLAQRLRDVLPPNRVGVQAVAQLHRDLGVAFGQAAASVAGDQRIDYIASHGQTIFHAGEDALSLQIGDAFRIRELLQTTVIYDFRSADCAAGGHGAPLVPYVDALLLGCADENRVAVNIGGIANLTFLAAGVSPQGAVAFDSGPGNMLIDVFVRERSSAAASYDENGANAARGRPDQALLAQMLADPYFAASGPKSTGHERFGTVFVQRYARELAQLTLEDGAATLTELTAISLAEAVTGIAPHASRVLLSGGGVHNQHLVRRLRERLTGYHVETSQTMGVPVDAKEALAFAVLGYETLRGRAAGLPGVTGARHASLLGALAPHDLPALLRKVHAECRQ